MTDKQSYKMTAECGKESREQPNGEWDKLDKYWLRIWTREVKNRQYWKDHSENNIITLILTSALYMKMAKTTIE